MERASIAMLIAVAACYRPAVDAACGVSCATAPCPGALVCGGNRLCHAAGAEDCTGGDATNGTCYDGQFAGVRVCVQTVPTDLRALSAKINTDLIDQVNCTSLQAQGDGTQVCVISAQELDVGTGVQVIGSHPLVLFATQLIAVHAPLDVASHVNPTKRGPGADDASCGAAGAGVDVGASGYGGGGGAGGSWQGTGGNGGGGTLAGGSRSNGGAPAPATGPGSLHGGCAGGRGGHDGASAAGAGGDGGGAVYLLSPQAILIASTIDASGGGGHAGTSSLAEGGGGGGTGGMIVLDAPTITLTASAVLIASGGGGGAGGARGSLRAASDGGEASSMAPAIGAPGGVGMGGGTGGAGSPRAAPPAGAAGTSGTATIVTGGGGGGGGGGYVLYFPSALANVQNTNISPIPQ